ncbi:NACHT domain-containing protein [Aliterella atlantica]|uniref:NTPase (NACHT family) n=2 Tax=Aliterella TaxID=1827277 RepID=A0A0D9A156_9CYAN|nr:NTPase (NACHT family) [Aliterella atlantica CENA595]
MTERARRSLKASPDGIKRAKKAVLAFHTKIDLAAELEISRATVQKFFAGKPVGRENFHHICEKLELPWQEVADISDDNTAKLQLHRQYSDINVAVQEVRDKQHASIQQKCGMIRVLDMSQPISLDGIYTKVNILEKIIGRRRLGVEELLKVCAADDFERPGLGKIIQNRISGLEAVNKYPKLIVLGKPGAGKTTFLKYLAMQCSLGKLENNKIPIFITLKDFAENDKTKLLLEYIKEQFVSYGIEDSEIAEQILSQGKALILLDGLDEIREVDCYRVLQEVRSFSSKFHRNYFAIACRIATHEYTLEEFTEVEIADFDSEQITTFTKNWFSDKQEVKSQKFIHKINQTPPIKELATNPLLLTMLCLVFEEMEDFPANTSELYKEGLNLLLRKWDAKRNIEREQIYKKLSVQHKEDLLSQIALKTFQRGDYFFKQNELERQIADYICNLPSVSTSAEILQLDSEAVLKSIEAQHGLLVERARGIYSFSHLTFHEYFAAKEIIASSDPQVLEQGLQDLVSHITERRWREIFLLTVGMLRNADYILMLMKQKIDRLLADDEQLQAFLNWVKRKSSQISSEHKLATIRAFYFDLDLARILNSIGGTLDLSRALDECFTHKLTPNLALDLALDRTLALDRIIDCAVQPSRVVNSVITRTLERSQIIDCELEQQLQQIYQQLPRENSNKSEFSIWWKNNSKDWLEKIRSIVISSRDIGYAWQFNSQQVEKLKQYYEANQLLVSCLISNSYMSRAVRQKIEDSLLLPIAEQN